MKTNSRPYEVYVSAANRRWPFRTFTSTVAARKCVERSRADDLRRWILRRWDGFDPTRHDVRIYAKRPLTESERAESGPLYFYRERFAGQIHLAAAAGLEWAQFRFDPHERDRALAAERMRRLRDPERQKAASRERNRGRTQVEISRVRSLAARRARLKKISASWRAQQAVDKPAKETLPFKEKAARPSSLQGSRRGFVTAVQWAREGLHHAEIRRRYKPRPEPPIIDHFGEPANDGDDNDDD